MGKTTEIGINDFETWCKKNNCENLLDEWDPANDITPLQISYGSHKKVKWICENGHRYEKDIHSRCQGTGCSICSGRTFVHRKAIFEEYPNLIEELDQDLNPYNDVKVLSSGSGKKVFWKCQKGHSYSMSPAAKTRSQGCPFCNNKRVLAGENDLETWCKKNNRLQILDDWDYSKNTMSPSSFLPGSNIKVWFRCHICGYEWKTVINSRTGQGADCRMCSRRINSSFPEQCIYYYISSNFPDAINGDFSALEGRELDVWVPSLQFAVEYDGKTWHKDSKRDYSKDELCREKGIILYRVREKGCGQLDSNDSITFEYDYEDWNSLSNIIIKILNDMGVNNPDVNIGRDEYIIKELYYKKSLENSLSNLYPEIASEWHPTLNGNIAPDLISAETHDSYYWLCPKGHAYKASPKNRVRMNSNCPFCSGQKVLKGFNDLETTNPVIALDFDNEKNKRKSYQVSKGCSDFFWFKCHKCNYEFKYQLSTYVARGGKCPICSAGKTKFQKVLKWETRELFDTLPQAAKSISQKEEDNTRIYKNIFNSCSGNTSTAYGFHWFYVSVDKNGDILDDLDSFEIKNNDKHITGQSKLMKNGQVATVIRDNGYTDIDIKFDDGTVVHTTRQSFKKGVVRNPNHSRMLGKTITDSMGTKSSIIGYRNSKDIDVRFEDGEIVEHTTLSKFNKGTIRKPKKSSKTSASMNKNTRIDLLGTTNIMKSGEKATCIKDLSYNDIDVQFEDNTIVKHVSRRSFLNGTVNNPNYIFTFLGKEKKMKCGLTCKITNITSKSDISVTFENGELVEHTTLRKFDHGEILTYALSHNYKYITGQRKLMNCGQYATVIEDRGAHDIDVRFDDGTILLNKARSHFVNGTLSIPHETSILGQTKIMNNGLSATVIADNGWDNIDVLFENGVVVKHRRREHFKGGGITCPTE